MARLIAAAIFQVEADFAGTTEILDALSELTHIIGGNLKALLPSPSLFRFPLLPDPPYWTRTTPQWQVVSRLTLESQGYPFVVALLGNQSSASHGELPSDGEGRRLAGNV